jgi:hypothetical protein
MKAKSNWTPELEAQLSELLLLDEATRNTIKFMTAARKAGMSPAALSSTISSKHRYQDRTIARAKEFAEEHGGKLTAFKAHEDGTVYAWDILIPLDDKFKLLIEINRTKEVEHWTDPLLMEARAFSGPRKKDDRFGFYLTQSMTELSRKDHLKEMLKRAQQHVTDVKQVHKPTSLAKLTQRG